jgi:hypothetical protein
MLRSSKPNKPGNSIIALRRKEADNRHDALEANDEDGST